MDNIQRRDAGMAYISDDAIFEQQKPARRLTQQLNTMDRSDFDGLAGVVRQLFGKAGRNVMVNPPFYCDYGFNIEVGDNFFCNYNCTMLDVARITFGDNCFLAPNVAIYTAGHPLHPDARNSLYEYGAPITVGDNVWIGGNVILLPGVRVGSNCVVAAGSVVTRDIPAWSVAAGNPARVIRTITEDDLRYYYKHQEFDPEAWAGVQAFRANKTGGTE